MKIFLIKKAAAYRNLSTYAHIVEHTPLRSPLRTDEESQISVHPLPLLARAATFLFQKVPTFLLAGHNVNIAVHCTKSYSVLVVGCFAVHICKMHKESKQLPSKFQISNK